MFRRTAEKKTSVAEKKASITEKSDKKSSVKSAPAGTNSAPSQDLKIPLFGSRVILAYNDTTEFAFERKLLWNDILPELQHFAFSLGFDLEWVDPMQETGTMNTQTAEQIIDILDQGNTDWIICMLGDKYGTIGPPTEIRKAEYESIRQAVFEQNSDVKLLDQNYAIDRSREHEEYRLSNPALDAKTKSKLVKVIQKGATAAFDEGVINQVNENRQRRFFQSPLHQVVNKAMSMGTRVLFILRMFQNAPYDKGSNSSYMEKAEDLKNAINAVKNAVTASMDQKTVFAHSLMLDSCDVAQFFGTRESDRYKNVLSRQLTERLKSQLAEAHSKIPVEAMKRLYTVASDEDATHTAILHNRLKKPWLSRVSHDKLVTQLLDSKDGGVFLIQGPELSGKTQFLCRLHEKATEKSYKIIRFCNVTYSSIFAHELWHHITTTLFALTDQPCGEIQKSFKLTSTLDLLEKLLEKLDKPLYLFLDDINLIKHGHFLSTVGKRLQKAPQKLFLYVTALNTTPVNAMYLVQQTVNLETPSADDLIEMLRLNMTTTNRKLSSEQFSTIKHQLTGSNCNSVLAESLMDELLQVGNVSMNGGMEGRLERLESTLGARPVQTVARYLTASLIGLTSLELFDVMSSNRDLMEALSHGFSMNPLLLDSILQSFGSMLNKVVLDNRVVYQISHPCLQILFRHRYFQNVAEIKAAHNDIVDVLADIVQENEIPSPRSALIYQAFPQVTKRDNGTFNIRKVRNLWYHLLHTGNMDALKDWTLCQFEYLEGVMSSCGIMHLLSLYEECAMQVLHHDIQVLCEQVLIPALPTVVRDADQLAAEVIGRLRFTRGENSHFLNSLVEKAMGWVDTYQRKPLLVPLSCWISPPIMKSCRSFTLKDWKAGQTILAPTHNHQHVLISGNLSAPGVIYMYHIPSQLLVTSFTGHSATVTSLSTSNSGAFFVSTSEDTTVKLWSFISGECAETYSLHKKKVMCSLLSSDDRLLITGSADSCAKVIEIETGNVIRNFTEHTGSVVSLQLTSNDEYLITGSGDFVVQIWSITKGNCVGRLGGLMAPVSCVAITSNDSYIIVGCEDETLRVYSTVSNQELHELMGHEGKVNALVAAQDDCQLFAGTKSRIYCYDLHNGQIIDIMDCQQASPVNSLKITADNFFLVSGCGPRIQVWNVHKRTYDAHDTSQDSEGFLTIVAMSPDERVAACGTQNGIVAIWDLDICQCIHTTAQSKKEAVTCLSFTLNNLYLMVGNVSGQITVFEISTGAVFREFSVHTKPVISICNIDSGKVFSVCRDGRMHIWTLNDEEIDAENYMEGVFPPIMAQPNGKTIIGYAANNSKEMKIWTQSEQGYTQKNKIYHNEEITCFSATAQGTLVATGSADHSLKLWQIESGFLTQILVGHESDVTCISMDEDERIVASGAKDQKLIIWSVTTGDFIHMLQISSPMTTIQLTQDASVLFTGMEDGWIECWSTDNGTLVSSFNAHKPVKQILRSFDGNRILAQLEQCAQLPILCLHNTPAIRAELKQRRRSARATSVTSLASGTSEPKKEVASTPSNTLQPGNGSTARLPPPRSTFDKLEKTKSRSSVIEKDRTTTLTTNTQPPPQKSGLCVIL